MLYCRSLPQAPRARRANQLLDQLRALDAGAGEDDDGELFGMDGAASEEPVDRRRRGGARRFDQQPVVGEPIERGDDFGLGDGDGVAAGFSQRHDHLAKTQRLFDRRPLGDRLGNRPRDRGSSPPENSRQPASS